MAFKLLCLLILCLGGCNAGVVPQHFMSDHTEPHNVKIERVSTNFDKTESNSTLGILKVEISNIAVGNDAHHNSSEVPIVGSHNISEELNHAKLNVSKESHSFVNNYSKKFDHSQIGETKGRSRKKSSKGTNRIKKNIPKETKKSEKVTKGHLNKDSLNESHHLEDSVRELSHPVKDLSKKSDHADDLIEDHFKDLLNGSHHRKDFVKGSNHSDKDVSKMIDHIENVTNINFHQNNINGSDQADEIVDYFNHFNNLLNESHHHDVLNHSDSDISKRFLEDDSVTKPVHHVELSESEHFENVSKTRNETLHDFETTRDFQMHFGNTSGTSDEIAESSPNSFEIVDDHIAFLHHADNISEDSNLRHDPSDFSTFHEDNIQKIGTETHSENPASEINPLFLYESFNSSEIVLNDTERFGMDIHISSAKDNSSSNLARNHTGIDILSKEDSSTLINHQNNETNSNDAYVMFTVSPNEDDTNSSTELSKEFLRDLDVNGSKLDTDANNSSIMAAEENATQGLFSGISIDFLLNSELAKNAASAMEVFNFTDSALTDHIVDDKNDVHDFLELIHPPEESDQAVSNEEVHDNIDIRENLNLGLNSSTSEDSEIIEVATTTVHSPTLLNSTVNFEETTIVPQFMLNSTVEFEETTETVSVFNSTVEFVEALCPPPGICIFWFLAQDTCAVNSHCLGSRICCRIGCAKTCIEV